MDEKYLEHAQALEQAERDAATQAAQRACAVVGSAVCVDCDEPIESARREAVPSAMRCFDCQRIFEHRKKGERR